MKRFQPSQLLHAEMSFIEDWASLFLDFPYNCNYFSVLLHQDQLEKSTEGLDGVIVENCSKFLV